MKLYSKAGVMVVICRKTLAILWFFHTIHYVISYANAQPLNDENDREIPNIPSSNIQTWDIQKNDQNIVLYANLIDVLEKLKVLPEQINSSGCVTLVKIVREIESDSSDQSSRRIKIAFHFIETVHSTESSGSAQNAHSSTDSKHPKYSVGGLLNPGCNKSSSFSAHGLDSLSMKQETDKGAKSVLEIDVNKDKKTSSRLNETGAVPLALEPKNGGQPKEEKVSASPTNTLKFDDSNSDGLSRTQVVVISTCSVVIGVFFLIAGALRLRNYYKRYRERRDTSVNANRRGSSLRLPGSTNSSGNLRRDSSCSKASRQSHSTVKSGSDVQIARNNKSSLLPHLSPALAITDQKPLLPSHSQISQHSNCSSHASIAYIDEDSSGKIKQNSDINDDVSDENEDFPLLRKSPDSGSYVSLAMDTLDDNENENEANENIDPQNTTKAVEQPNEAKKHLHSLDQNLNVESEDNKEKPFINGFDTEDQSVNEVRVESEHTSAPDLIDSFHSNDTDTEIANGFDEENIADSFVVTIGLNQSDSSISENPSYSYGNQTEYSPYGGLDFDDVCLPGHEAIHKYKLAFDCYDEGRRISNFMENESDYRENGTCDGTPSDKTDSHLHVLDSPESLYSLKNMSVSDKTDKDTRGSCPLTHNFDANIAIKNVPEAEGKSNKPDTRNWQLVPLMDYYKI